MSTFHLWWSLKMMKMFAKSKCWSGKRSQTGFPIPKRTNLIFFNSFNNRPCKHNWSSQVAIVVFLLAPLQFRRQKLKKIISTSNYFHYFIIQTHRLKQYTQIKGQNNTNARAKFPNDWLRGCSGRRSTTIPDTYTQ